MTLILEINLDEKGIRRVSWANRIVAYSTYSQITFAMCAEQRS